MQYLNALLVRIYVGVSLQLPSSLDGALTAQCWFVSASPKQNTVSLLFLADGVIVLPHRRPASPPFGLFQSICAEPATGSGFGRATLQAAGHVLQQTGAPLGKHAGDGTGSTFLCCGSKRASVCVTACPMYVCEHGQKLSARMHQRVAASVPSTSGHCERGSTQEGKPQNLSVMFWYVIVCVNRSRWSWSVPRWYKLVMKVGCCRKTACRFCSGF